MTSLCCDVVKAKYQSELVVVSASATADCCVVLFEGSTKEISSSISMS